MMSGKTSDVRTVRPILSNVGLRLGAGTAIISAIMDQEQERFPDGRKMAEAWTMTLINLLIIGPFVYARVFVPRQKNWIRSIVEAFALTGIHSACYAVIHRCMHRVTALRPMHRAHHRYATDVVPSVANAVSVSEFLTAYMTPFAIGSFLIRPSEHALLASAAVVSVLNLIVHSSHISTTLPATPFTVHPREHLDHHRHRTPSYSAPSISWEKMWRRVVTFFR